MTEAERRERARLRSERWRRAHGIMPRRPAQKPWLAEGVSRSTWYRRGNRILLNFSNLKSKKFLDLPGSEFRNLRNLKSNNLLDLSRASAFVAQLQSELAEVARCQAVTAAIIGELACYR